MKHLVTIAISLLTLNSLAQAEATSPYYEQVEIQCSFFFDSILKGQTLDFEEVSQAEQKDCVEALSRLPQDVIEETFTEEGMEWYEKVLLSLQATEGNNFIENSSSWGKKLPQSLLGRTELPYRWSDNKAPSMSFQ